MIGRVRIHKSRERLNWGSTRLVMIMINEFFEKMEVLKSLLI